MRLTTAIQFVPRFRLEAFAVRGKFEKITVQKSTHFY